MKAPLKEKGPEWVAREVTWCCSISMIIRCAESSILIGCACNILIGCARVPSVSLSLYLCPCLFISVYRKDWKVIHTNDKNGYHSVAKNFYFYILL
jgi:hypothetical protein